MSLSPAAALKLLHVLAIFAPLLGQPCSCVKGLLLWPPRRLPAAASPVHVCVARLLVCRGWTFAFACKCGRCAKISAVAKEAAEMPSEEDEEPLSERLARMRARR